MFRTKLHQFFKLPNPGLKRYFGIVRKGQPEVYRSTFYSGKEPSTVLFDWNKRLGRIGSKWPTLLEFEMDLAKKVGPMSVMQPLNKRYDDIDSYYDDVKTSARPVDPRAIELALEEWGPVSSQSVKLQSRAQTVANMRLSTNSGSPYFTRRRNAAKLDYQLGMDGDEVWYSDPRWDGNLCAILGWRGQEGGPTVDDVKQRVVWMFPFPVNIEEARVYQPLISAFQNTRLIPAWISNDEVDRRITRLFDTKGDKDLILCTDFSKFDQHFNVTLQSAARSAISSLLPNTASHLEWLDDIYPIKYMIPLMCDVNEVKYGFHGMGSGSGGTNFDETIAHRILQHEAALTHGSTLNQNSQCLGDDGILSYPGITVDDVLETYRQHGLEMNESKQYSSTSDCVYLRRWHHKDYREMGICVGVYSTCRALGRLMFQERFYDPEMWGPEAVALRQLSIIENVKYHPLREAFAEFCMKGDKYRLGIDLPGFLTNIQSEAEKLTDIMPDFLGYTRTNMSENNRIDDWWIVRYLRNFA